MTVAQPLQLTITSPLVFLDPQEVSAAAKKETRNREVYLPPLSVFRWWARRTEAVNGAVLDAFSAQRGVSDPLLVVDPFAGGGVIPLAALLRGHDVYAQDINPWAAAGLTSMLGLPSPERLRQGISALSQRVSSLASGAYGTTMSDGRRGAISHTFRVAVAECVGCQESLRLFPHAMVTSLVRKERGQPEAFVACRRGHLFLGRSDKTSRCPECRTIVDPADKYTSRRIACCHSCGRSNSFVELVASGTWRWEVVLVERASDRHRELAIPTAAEVATAEDPRWTPTRDLGLIPNGQETRVLLRHGFRSWNDLYPDRQRYFIEHLLENVSDCTDDAAVSNLLRMAIIGSCEMAGLCSRWDRWYLKSYESMAGHRFNFTTLTVEPNVWGTSTSGRGTVIRRIDQLIKAATWMHEHTTVSRVAGPVDPTTFATDTEASVVVAEGSSETMALATGVADVVLTDPPYHDDVQYAELSLPLRAWADLSTGALKAEAVVNSVTGQNSGEGYADLLTRIFHETNRVLKTDGHLVFSFANRSPKAWVQVFQALQEAGLRAVGCEIFHSENERDQSKRGVRACNLDLMLDLAPSSGAAIEQHRPRNPVDSDEADFLRLLAGWFLRVGNLSGDWQSDLEHDLANAAFLA